MQQFIIKNRWIAVILVVITTSSFPVRADESKAAEVLRAAGAKVVISPKTQFINRVSIKGVDLSKDALAALSGLNSLESLSLTGQGVTGVQMDAVSKIATLHSVDLAEATITDKELAMLSKLPELSALYLYGTKVTENGLAALATFPNLKLLGLRGEQFTDRALVHIASIKRLETLYLSKTSVTLGEVKKFQARFPKCRISVKNGL